MNVLTTSRPVPVETGAAKIVIELRDGRISVTHGTEDLELAVLEQAPAGTWNALWAALMHLGFQRNPIRVFR